MTWRNNVEIAWHTIMEIGWHSIEEITWHKMVEIRQPIFRSSVYDPGFKGSFSIKEVAPAILGKSASYAEMDVGGGTEAQSAYMEMIDPSTEKKRKEELRKSLIEYCTKDTNGMVDLVDWLFEAAQGVKLKPRSKKNGN